MFIFSQKIIEKIEENVFRASKVIYEGFGSIWKGMGYLTIGPYIGGYYTTKPFKIRVGKGAGSPALALLGIFWPCIHLVIHLR